MFLALHITVALSGLAISTRLFMRPNKHYFTVVYALVASTFGSGVYLVISTNSHMLQACVSGLVYLGFVSLLIAGAHKKLAKENA